MLPSSTSDARLQLIRCGVADESYGLASAAIRGLHTAERLRRQPAGDGRLGVLPGRGGETPVFGLAQRLGRPPASPRGPQHLVVLNTEPGPWALLVDRVAPVPPMPADRLVPLPAIAGVTTARFFKGILALEKDLLLVLAPEQLHPEARRWPPTVLPPLGPLGPRAAGPSQGRLVLFTLAPPRRGQRPLTFGLSVTQVLEVLAPPSLMPLPGAPTFVLGLARWRGRPVPVLDLAARLGLADTSPPQRSRLLIARSHHDLVGFPVRSAVRTLALPVAHRPSERALSIDMGMTRGVVELASETLAVLDLGALLGRPARDRAALAMGSRL